MFIYFLLFRLAALFNPKAKKIVRGQKLTWARLTELNKQEGEKDKYVWFHAASVGEFEQARPVIERLKQEQPSRKVLLTFFSCSGYEMRKDYPYADLVLYLPFATRRNARRFLSMLHIEMAIFVKYEFWPAYLRELRRREIPTYIIAAIFRPSQLFFKWYGRSYRRLLHCFTKLFVQDQQSLALLEKYGVPNASIAGDTRFDRVSAICAKPKDIPEVQRFITPVISPISSLEYDSVKVIVAGSTWPQDEQLLCRYVATHPDVRLVLVPHELNDAHLHYIFNLFQGRFVRFSEATMQNLTTCRVLLLDTMGMLSSVYRYGQVAYVGGGFGEGIHNTIEPAVYGMPVLFGPNNRKFREAQRLLECGAAFQVTDYPSFEAAMDEALANYPTLGPKAAAYVQSELGATNTIYNALFR